MTNLPEGFWTPEKAVPLLRDPDFQELVKLTVAGQTEAIDLLNHVQVALAFRLGCVSVDPETEVSHANVPIDGNRLWGMLMRQYNASCMTKPDEFFAEINPADPSHATVQYIVPLAAFGKQKKAVIAKYDYSPRATEKYVDGFMRRLGRKAIEKIQLGNNPFYVARASDNPSSPRSFSGYRVFEKAMNDGHLGSTPL